MTGAMENGDRLGAIRRRWVVVVIAGVLGALVALALAGRQAARYEASAEVAVNQQSLPSGASGSAFASAQQLQRQVETLASVAASPAVATVALRKAPGSGLTPEQLLASTRVQPSSNADVLTISVSARSRALAGALATAYGKAFAAYENGLTRSAIDGQLQKVARQIAAANDAIAHDTAGGGQPTAEHRQTLSSLLNKQSDLQALRTSTAQSVTVLRPGNDAHQTAPRPLRSALLGGLLGVIFGCAAAFGLDAVDRRVTSPADVEALLPLPLIARVGRQPKQYAKRLEVIALREPDHVHAEGYRMARTNLDIAMLRRSIRSIAVSSALPGEGKSTFAANVAVAFAESGRTVALVDLDLRRPTIGPLFHLPESAAGVGEVLRGDLPAGACLEPVPLGAGANGAGSLDVLTAHADNRADVPFLTRESLERVVEELLESHDLVLFDTPPLLAVSEPAIVGAAVDAMVVVVRSGVARRPALADMSTLLTTLDVPVLGYVFTGATGSSGYGYGYGYGGPRSPVVANGQAPPSGNGTHDRPLVPADLDV